MIYIIAHEMLVEDLEVLKKEKAKSPIKSVKFVKPKTDIGDKNETQNKKNRNGIVGKNGPRKLCNNCNSAGHLTYACKNAKVEKHHNVHVHNMPAMPVSHKCAITTCIPCTANLMAAFLNVTHASTVVNNCLHDDKCKNKMHSRTDRAKTASPPKSRKESTSPKPRSKSVEASIRKVEAVTKSAQNVKHAKSANKNDSTSQAKKEPTHTKPRSKITKVYVRKVKVVTENVKSVENAEPVLKPVKYANVSKPYGPNQTWVPKQT